MLLQFWPVEKSASTILACRKKVLLHFWAVAKKVFLQFGLVEKSVFLKFWHVEKVPLQFLAFRKKKCFYSFGLPKEEKQRNKEKTEFHNYLVGQKKTFLQLRCVKKFLQDCLPRENKTRFYNFALLKEFVSTLCRVLRTVFPLLCLGRGTRSYIQAVLQKLFPPPCDWAKHVCK